jgi:hypothetical protein
MWYGYFIEFYVGCFLFSVKNMIEKMLYVNTFHRKMNYTTQLVLMSEIFLILSAQPKRLSNSLAIPNQKIRN